MVDEQFKLANVSNVQQFKKWVCSQCELCFRSPKDPSLFCFPKFVANRHQFVEEFLLQIVYARQHGKPLDKYRKRGTFKKVFCNWKNGACPTRHHNCGKKRMKKCFKKFSGQILNMEMEDQRGNAVNDSKTYICDDDDYCGYGYGYKYKSSKVPDMTIIGKKKFQNKVEKILDEDTD